MSIDERVVVNAGGKRFETTASTLVNSGSGYFEALLGETGAAMRGRKRARVSDDGDQVEAGPRELFVDRDPELFADVLKFMRANRLPATARDDAARLDDLKAEAEFLCCDGLAAACDEATAKLEAAKEARVLPEAQHIVHYVEPGDSESDSLDSMLGPPFRIDVPEGQILYLDSIVPRPYFYNENASDATEVRQNAALFAYFGNRPSITDSHLVDVAHSTDDHKYRRRKLDLCFQGGREVQLRAAGAMAFEVYAWVGHPSKIPGLARH